MYRFFILFLVMLLTGCGNGKESVAETRNLKNVEFEVIESTDNEYNRLAAAAYRKY